MPIVKSVSLLTRQLSQQSESVWAVHLWSGLQKCQKLSPIFLALRARRYCEMSMSEKGLKILISALKSESDFHYLSLLTGLLLYLAGHR